MQRSARSITLLAFLLVFSILGSGWSTTQAFDPGEPVPPEDVEKFEPNYVRAPDAPAAISSPDQFGYYWDDSGSLNWKDATSGTPIFAPGSDVDDGVVGPIPLPVGVAPFSFYENQYTEVYVGSNGLLGFNDSIADDGASLENLPVPLDYEHPQAILAPFWDDLVIGGGYNTGGVFWDSGQDAFGKFFVVEWHQVSRVFSTDLLTFEIVMYEGGTILFQYLDLNGNLNSATVGVEDSDGVDGLEYLYNGTGQPLSSGKTIQFNPPVPGYRTKAFPTTQGGMNSASWSTFVVYVRNTGDQGSDTYNLSATSSAPGWQVFLFDYTGVIPLLDTTSGDGLPDTGPLGMGETFTVTVRLQKPDGAGVGMETSVTLNVASDSDPAEDLDVDMTTLVPAPFALTFREGQSVFTELISTTDTYKALEHDEFRGSSFAISALPQANYVGLWEHNELGTSYTNLYYTMVSNTGLLLYDEPRQLTNNLDPGKDVRDFAPVLAAAPNGNIGVAWVRIKMGLDPGDSQTFLRINRNVFFAILNSDGSQLLQESNLTNDTGWYQYGDADIPQYENLNLAASSDGYFHLAWVEKHSTLSQTTTDLAYAVYNSSNGFATRPPALFTSGDPDDDFDYFEPALTSYTNAFGLPRVLLFYFLQDNTIPGSPVFRLAYNVLQTVGTVEIGQTLLHTGSGYGSDADQLSDGRVVVAWTDTVTESDRVAYIVLRQNLANPPPASYLYNPDGRPGGIVSVTHDTAGHAILTWMDSKWFQRLYYALVDAGGALNLPLIFKYSGLGGVSGIQTSDGQGNAFYIPWYRNLLPWIARP